MEGERVVGAANFLLDSESRMRAASAGVFNPETDPVCGMEVDRDAPRAPAGRRRTTATRIYFCSDDCKKKFEAEPAKYAEPQGHGPCKAGSRAKTSMPACRKPRAVQQAAAVDEGPRVRHGRRSEGPAVAARKVEYKGKAYYFCSDDCKAKFEAEPGGVREVNAQGWKP